MNTPDEIKSLLKVFNSWEAYLTRFIKRYKWILITSWPRATNGHLRVTEVTYYRSLKLQQASKLYEFALDHKSELVQVEAVSFLSDEVIGISQLGQTFLMHMPSATLMETSHCFHNRDTQHDVTVTWHIVIVYCRLLLCFGLISSLLSLSLCPFMSGEFSSLVDRLR